MLDQLPISSSFSAIVKPIGPRCNLRCSYCYYLAKEEIYPPGERWRMTREVLEETTRQVLGCLTRLAEVSLDWQGGEPTMRGLAFFEDAVSLQRRHAAPGQIVANSLQTNGLLIDRDWCRFLAANRFLVGLSLDGPPEVHDRCRHDARGRSSSGAVLRALQRLEEYEVDVNVLCAVHRDNVQQPREIYRFLVSRGVRYIQLIPVVQPDPRVAGGLHPASVTAEAWGEFLLQVFDEWSHGDVGRVFVTLFDAALTAHMGLPQTQCSFARTCGRAVVIEHNGDVYSCDHFVDPEHRLGNLTRTPLRRLLDAPEQRLFARHKRDARPAACGGCDVVAYCHGECPRNWLARGDGAEPPAQHLCAGYQRFFREISPALERMAAAIRDGRPASSGMP